MKRIATAVALVSLLLAGCGASPAAPAVKKTTAKTSTAASAKTAAANAEKGLLGMFKIAFAHLDTTEDGALTAEEFAVAAEEEVLPGLPAFAAIDADKDGAISLAEFTAKKLLAGKTTMFTERATAEFQGLDADKSKSLSKTEMADADVTFAAADADKNGKVTAAEFEAALAIALSKAGS